MIVRWWPRGKRLPRGWVRVDTSPSHHDAHSILIAPRGKKRATIGLTGARKQAQNPRAG